MKKCCKQEVGVAIEAILKSVCGGPDDVIDILANLIHIFNPDLAIIDRSFIEDNPDPKIREHLKHLDDMADLMETIAEENEASKTTTPKGGGQWKM